jgi:preprotein translocase subunit SecD
MGGLVILKNMDILSAKITTRLKIITILSISIIASYVLIANIVLHFSSGDQKWKKIFNFAPKVQFGLDIVGGSQLLIAVDFDKFIEDKYISTLDDIKHSLWENRVQYNKIVLNKDTNEIIVITMGDTKNIAKAIQSVDHNLSTDTNSNNVIVKYDANYLEDLRSKITEQSMAIIQRRIDSAGTKEIVIYRHGKDKIILQVPGVSDPSQLKRLLGKTAKLSFHLMDEREPFLKSMPNYIEEDKEVLFGGDRANLRLYKIVKKPALNGDVLIDARSSVDNMKVSIVFRLNNSGAKKFGQITRDNVGKPFAIVLDNKVLTAPTINEPIFGGNGTISGSFSVIEAQELAGLLKSGALPTQLNIIEERVVGPSIGKMAIDSARMAFGVGIGLLMLFMLIYYRILGLVANIAIILNLACAITVMAIFKFSITLPGIAALILTLGMSIDANVLIYERMRDELGRKKTDILIIIKQGFHGAFSAIIDSNITTILSAVPLVAIGSGCIRGFAISLIVGLLTSLFTAIVFTKLVIEFLAKNGKLKLYLK